MSLASRRSKNDRLVQTRISKSAGAKLAEKARGAGLTEAAYVRILLLRDLGLLAPEGGS